MADLSESIRSFLVTGLADSSIHVGEDVPQEIPDEFVWFMRSGDELDDELCHPPTVLSVRFDVECVSDDIDVTRSLTHSVKELFRNAALHSVTFVKTTGVNQRVHAFDVENHDDSYIPHNIQLDERLQIGTFQLTVHLGETY